MICKNCGAEFKPISCLQVFCSRKCKTNNMFSFPVFGTRLVGYKYSVDIADLKLIRKYETDRICEKVLGNIGEYI